MPASGLLGVGSFAILLFKDLLLPYLRFQMGVSQFLFPFPDLKHPDSWLTSSKCWTDFCLQERSNFVSYGGKNSPTHISNGTIANISSSLNSAIMGLQTTDTLNPQIPLLKGRWLDQISNVSFVDGYHITSSASPKMGGMLGLGTIYGLQTDLLPVTYGAYLSGQITDPVFSIWWNNTQSYLFLGIPNNPNVSAGSVCENIPLVTRDGTWNFAVQNLLSNGVSSDLSGLGVLDLLDYYITLPKSVGAAFATAAGVTTTTIDGVDYYNGTFCDALPDLTFVTAVGSIPLTKAMYSQQQGAICYIRIRGDDLYNAAGALYWSLGLPLLLNYYISYNFTLGAETMSFNITGLGE